MRATDWGGTPVGPVHSWPAELKCAVGMLLHSRHPMFLWWGPELVQFYNDAYLPSFGEGKHPQAMGQGGRACWGEIWHIIGPQIEAVMTGADATWNEDALVPIFRNSVIEEVYWTYGYSPVLDVDGAVAGVLVVCTETTARVLSARRQQTVLDIAASAVRSTEPANVGRAILNGLSHASRDVPFAVSYARDGALLRREHSLRVAESSLAALDACVQRAVAACARGRFGPPELIDLPAGVCALDSPWPESPTRAVLLQPKARELGVLLLGLSPRLPFDAAYGSFFAQLHDQIDASTAELEVFRIRVAMEGERRNLLLQAPVGTALLRGPNHVFELANQHYKDFIGGRDVVGLPYFEAFPELVGTELGAIVDRVYQEGRPFVAHEFRVPMDRKGSGTVQDCYFRFNLEPLRDDAGRVSGMMVIALDITEQVEARIVLERATAEKERLVAELEAANKAKDEFLATVSHELRTPLTSILGWARVLTEGAPPAQLQKGIAVIERNAKAQSQLIDDILDMSRIIAGKVRMNLRYLSPEAVIDSVLNTMRPAADAKSITLSVEIQGELGHIAADEDRMQQVVWNILSNAVKFTPKNGTVRLRAARDERNLTIEVSDSGKGISAELLPFIFDRFRQGDSSTTKQHGGLGLGLAIVRQLVELHGGAVRAHSAGQGRGATFEVQFPVSQAQLLDTLPPVAPSMTESGVRGRLHDVRVLVVDDQEDARDLIATVLEHAGARVVQADSAAVALALIAAKSFSVLVSDIGMPGEDGYSLIHALRNHGGSLQARGLPALALTAFARAEDRDRALSAGFQRHLPKPIDPSALLHAVWELSRRP